MHIMNPPPTQRHNCTSDVADNHNDEIKLQNHFHYNNNDDDNDDDDDYDISAELSHRSSSSSSSSKFSFNLCLAQKLFPFLLLFLGLSIFTQSFFLSRTTVDVRSSCDLQSAGNLLVNALGFDDDRAEEDVEYLRQMGWLSDGNSNGGGEDSTNHNIGIGIDDHSISNSNYGCWVPRRVDSMAILVVDALRFDFARDHLPLSVGSRLFTDEVEDSTKRNYNSRSTSISKNEKKKGMSKLYRFVADPPTVTMQRLKGLTTGGLPTFADITGSFGGASIHEDSWVEQLKAVPWNRRRSQYPRVYNESQVESEDDVRIQLQVDSKRPLLAFVGDDTW